jgi:hypothetical protein
MCPRPSTRETRELLNWRRCWKAAVARIAQLEAPIAPAAVPAARKKRLVGKRERFTRAREAARTYRIPWADLLAKVFEIDVLACPECGSRMMLIAFIAEPTVAKRILDHLRLSTGPPLAPARGGQADSVDPAPAYDVPDPVYEN